MELYRALGIKRGDVVAFVGAGGKSSAILQAVRELEESAMPVLIAPTTKMFVREAEMAGTVLICNDRHELRSKSAEMLDGQGAVVIGSTLLSKRRVKGVETDWVPDLAPKNGVTLVEADGARRRPLKGPAAHEPLLPDGATLVVAVGGVSALGGLVNEENVHRPDVFAELTGAAQGHTIDTRSFALALLAGLRSVPDTANRAALLTNVEPGQSMARASSIAHQLWRGGVSNVVMSSLPKEAPGRVWTP